MMPNRPIGRTPPCSALRIPAPFNVEAHDCFLRGRELLLGSSKNREVFDQVVIAFRRAIELDPG